MPIQREEIDKLANPFLALECQERDLGSLALEVRSNPDHVIRVLRGEKCRTKQEFLDEVAAAFQFPYYFGKNWDAFDECINDLGDWLPAHNYLALVTNAEELLFEEPFKEFETLTRILRRAAERWRSGFNQARYHAAGGPEDTKKTEFAVVFQYPPGTIPKGNFGNWLNAANIPRLD